MRYKRSIIAVFLAAVVVLTGFRAFGAETFNRVVAIVNDDVITLYELNRKIKEVTGMTPIDLKEQNENAYLDARRSVLELLIDDKIYQRKIKELGIQVTQAQVDKTIERIKRHNRWTQEDLLYQIEKDGLTFEQYEGKVRSDLEKVSLINFEVKSKIIIREEMVQEYYEKHIDEFSEDEKVHLANIILITQDPGDQREMEELINKGKRILDELRKGKNFGELAKKYSMGPTASEGGDLGEFKTSQLGPDIRKVLRGMPAGGFSKLILRENGIQIIQLLNRQGGKNRSLDEVREAINDILYQREVEKRYNNWIKELREDSYTKINF